MQISTESEAEIIQRSSNAQAAISIVDNDIPIPQEESDKDEKLRDLSRKLEEITLKNKMYEMKQTELEQSNSEYQKEVAKLSKDVVNLKDRLIQLEKTNLELIIEIGELQTANEDLIRQKEVPLEENHKLKTDNLSVSTQDGLFKRESIKDKKQYLKSSSLLTNVLNEPVEAKRNTIMSRINFLSGAASIKNSSPSARKGSGALSDSPVFMKDRSPSELPYESFGQSYKGLRANTSYMDESYMDALTRSRIYTKTFKTRHLQDLRKTMVYGPVNSMYFGNQDASQVSRSSEKPSQLKTSKRIPRFERKEIADKNGSLADCLKFKPRKLFEDFFVIGTDRESVLEFLIESPQIRRGNLPPKVLWNFQTTDSLAIPPKKSMENFVFPFGVRIKDITHDKEEKTIMKEKLFTDKGRPTIAKMMFPLIPGDLDVMKEDWEFLAEKMNSHHLMYFVCIVTHDYLVMKKDEIIKHLPELLLEEDRIYRIETALCFMTYYPVIPFFYDLTRSILNQFWHIRRELYIKGLEGNSVPDFISSLNIYDDHIKTSLKLIYDKCPTPQCDKKLEISQKDSIYKPINSAFAIPSINEVFSMESLWGSYLVFGYLPLKDIKWIVSAILLEKKVVIFSKNITLLSATMSVLLTLIKPFKYTYPFIFNLPGVLLDICDAPGAGITGINQGEDYFWNEDMISLYQSCLFIFLDSKKAYALEETKMHKMPTFQDFDLRLNQSYKEINDSSEEIEKFFNLKSIEKVKLKEEVKQIKNEKSSGIPEAVKYFRSHVIFMLIQLTWTEKIIKPVEQSALQRNFNVEKVFKDIIGQYYFGENKEFLREFLQTQIFGYFIQFFLPDSFLFHQ